MPSNKTHLKPFFQAFLIRKLLLFLLLTISTATAQENTPQNPPEIPEPLLFDLVRGLGAAQGELEINALADFPLNNTDQRGIEWAPEIEYALFDGFAVELEFPMTDGDLEAYKMALQWTIGSAKNNKFIHGIQLIAEKYVHEDILELNFLYIPAYRFNKTWSAIGLFGVMLESGADSPDKSYTILLNASVFANLNERMVLGLEINNSDPTFQKIDNNEMELLLLPQLHYELHHGYELQFGLGPKFSENKTNSSAVLRLIKTF